MPSSMRRIAFYSSDERGVGHVRRSIAIADAIAADRPSSIVLVAGAREAALFELPEVPALLDALVDGARFARSDGRRTARTGSLRA
jgi:predicted glycosyltransferase